MAGFMPVECRTNCGDDEMMKGIAGILFAAILMSGCTQPAPTNGPGSPNDDPSYAVTGDQKADWQRILDLEERAKASVRTDGCTSGDQCRSAPVGSRACGGPRYYLVYCARTTDSAALFRSLEQVAAAERAYNTKYQVMSTCEFRMPPSVGVTGGMCAAQTTEISSGN
jgi:hypothetical protein